MVAIPVTDPASQPPPASLQLTDSTDNDMGKLPLHVNVTLAVASSALEALPQSSAYTKDEIDTIRKEMKSIIAGCRIKKLMEVKVVINSYIMGTSTQTTDRQS